MSEVYEYVDGYDHTNSYSDDMIFDVSKEDKSISVIRKQTLISGERNSQYIAFQMPRYYDGIDLSEKNIEVIYVTETGTSDINKVINVRRNDEELLFGWVVPGGALQTPGTLSFCIEFAGNEYVMKTMPVEVEVFDGMNGSDIMVEPSGQVWYMQIQNLCSETLEKAQNYMQDARKACEQAVLVKKEIENSIENKESGSMYNGKTIVAFGDSIIAGWGWKEGTGVIQPLKEKYTSATWLNQAESGANMAVTSSPAHTPIVTQITTYTGAADAIILDGGVNDKNSAIPIGSITAGYDDTYDTGTVCGAMESALQYIMDTYPLAIKVYIIPHAFSKDNSYLDDIYAKAIEICEKWNMPYLDMRKYSQIAMTAKNKRKYTRNPNTNVGDGVHPTEEWYRTFYSPVLDQFLRKLGIGGSSETSEVPDNVPVTGVTLDKSTLSMQVGASQKLTATVRPSNATNRAVTWRASNSNITVANGTVTANSAGSAVVTVQTADGGYMATCNITVQESVSEGHTELGSITLDGNCYFDTDIYPDQNTNTEAKLFVGSGSTYICGARDSSYKYGYTCTDNFYVIRGTISSAAKIASAFWEDDWVVKQNGTEFAFNSKTVNTDAINSFTLTSPFYIGNMSQNKEAAGAGLKGKVYYAKIYSGSELVADMVPVKKADGTLCLWDKVRKKYLYKRGTGTLAEE